MLGHQKGKKQGTNAKKKKKPLGGHNAIHATEPSCCCADVETKMSSRKLEDQSNATATVPTSVDQKGIARELWAFHGDQNAANVNASRVLSRCIGNCKRAPTLSIMNADGDQNAS